MKKSFKKLLCVVLSACMLLSLMTVFADETAKHPFTDVASDAWYYEVVQNVWEKGIIKGMTDTTFEPQSSLTRGMFVTVLGRLAGVDPAAYTESSFSDVAATDWFGPYVIWAAENGIANGVTETEFAPNSPVVRQQMAAFIQRYLSNAGYAVQGGGSLDYSDNDAIADYAKEAVLTCQNAGIMQGADGSFLPEKETTRAEAAAVITRLEAYSTPAGIDEENAAVIGEGLLAEKVVNCSAGKTVHPGEELKYTIRVQNNGEETAAVTILDVVPDYTTLIAGGDVVSDGELSWEVTIPAGKLQEVSYIVKVDDDINLCGNASVINKAIINGISLSCPEIYIDRTFNIFDQKKVKTAIFAMSNSEFSGIELAKNIYYVATSKSFTMDGTPSEVLDKTFSDAKDEDGESAAENINLQKMVAPMLYGGKAVAGKPAAYLRGEKAETITRADLVVGDLLLIENNGTKVYLYDGEAFVEMLANGVIKTDANGLLAALDTADRFAVYRPSMGIQNINYSVSEKEEELSAAQEALIATAESYLLRGSRLQYADSNMYPYGEDRFQTGVNAPEDCTVDDWGYTNCASFCHDVYLFGLDYEIGMYTTRKLIAADNEIRPFYYAVTGEETEAEKEEVEKKFYETLLPGDIIVYRFSGGGHAMFYAGNGTIIHSTGYTYKYATQVEQYEASIRYRSYRDLFTPTDSRYVFGGKLTELALVRPLNTWSGEIPENTVNRMENMQGVIAEKRSFPTYGQSVNPGSDVTFRFVLTNAGEETKTLEIKDTIPQNTTLVSGGATVEGNNLSWTVTVPAGEMATVEYTVRVNDDKALCGNYVESRSTVGGVSVNCKKILIENTLTAEEQLKVLAALDAYEDFDASAFETANAIYKNALGVEQILPGEDFAAIDEGVFYIDAELTDEEKEYFQFGRRRLREEGTYSEMVIPSLFGSRGVAGYPAERTRLPRTNKLMVGDLVVSKTTDGEVLCMFDGEDLVDLETGNKLEDTKVFLASLLGLDNYSYFFVALRPAMAID